MATALSNLLALLALPVKYGKLSAALVSPASAANSAS